MDKVLTELVAHHRAIIDRNKATNTIGRVPPESVTIVLLAELIAGKGAKRPK